MWTWVPVCQHPPGPKGVHIMQITLLTTDDHMGRMLDTYVRSLFTYLLLLNMSWAHVEIMNIVNMESESVVETQVFRGVATDWTVFINYDSNQNFRGTLARAASPDTDNCRAAIWPDKHQLRSFLLHRCHARTSKLYVLIKPLSMKNLTHSFVRAKSKDTTTVIDRLWHTCIIPRSHLPLQPGLTRVSPSVNAIRTVPAQPALQYQADPCQHGLRV